MTYEQEAYWTSIAMWFITSVVILLFRYVSVWNTDDFYNQSRLKNLFYQLKTQYKKNPPLNIPTIIMIIVVAIPVYVWLYNWIKYFIHRL